MPFNEEKPPILGSGESAEWAQNDFGKAIDELRGQVEALILAEGMLKDGRTVGEAIHQLEQLSGGKLTGWIETLDRLLDERKKDLAVLHRDLIEYKTEQQLRWDEVNKVVTANRKMIKQLAREVRGVEAKPRQDDPDSV